MSKPVHQIKGGPSQAQPWLRKHTPKQRAYIERLCSVTGTDEPDWADLNRQDAKDLIVILEHRAGRTPRVARRNTKYGRRPSPTQQATIRLERERRRLEAAETVNGRYQHQKSCQSRPPTTKQITYLRKLASRGDYTYAQPGCICEATRQISQLRRKGGTKD